MDMTAGLRGELAGVLLAHVPGARGNRDTGGKALDINGEVHARQRLVKIVDVEKNVVFRCAEGPEVHQVTIAAGLHRRAGHGLVREIMGHDSGRATQKGKWTGYHACIALADKFGHARRVAFGEDRDGITRQRPMQFAMGFARRMLAQRLALLQSLPPARKRSGHGGSLRMHGDADGREALSSRSTTIVAQNP